MRLYVRILGWFFLNLLLLAAIFAAFFFFQFHFGLDSLLAGRAGERIDNVAALITSEIRETPPEDWGGILARFDSAYGVQFALFGQNGTQLAGESVSLPTELALHERGRPPLAPPRERGLRPRRQEPQEPFGPPEPGNPPRPPLERKLIVRAGDPARYWIVVRTPPLEGAGRGPVLLVISSENLGFGGLVFDPAPWLLTGGAIILLSVAYWWPLVRGITQAITAITQATEKIARGDFETRVSEPRGDEIGTLGKAINRMATRLAGFIDGQKRFLGDTAHELVSPLARMEMALGILDQRTALENRPYVEDVRDEVRQMSRLVDELLSFSKASLHARTANLASLRLLDLVEEVAAREDLASNVQIQVSDALFVKADPTLLGRALGNVLRNALRYAGTEEPIVISAGETGSQIELHVCDSGPGVPEGALVQIFDPFFRIDSSRDRDTGGTGLGLAIARSCLEACGGSISCSNRLPSGLDVKLTLKRTTALAMEG